MRLFHAFFLGAARPKKMKKKNGYGRWRKAVHDSQKPSESRPKTVRKPSGQRSKISDRPLLSTKAKMAWYDNSKLRLKNLMSHPYERLYFVLRRKVAACKLFRALSTFGQHYRLFHAFFFWALRAQKKNYKKFKIIGCFMHFFWALRAQKKWTKKTGKSGGEKPSTIAKSRPKTCESRPKTSESRPKSLQAASFLQIFSKGTKYKRSYLQRWIRWWQHAF